MKKFFTRKDFEEGLCDENGVEIKAEAQTTAPEQPEQPEQPEAPAQPEAQEAPAQPEAPTEQQTGKDASGQPNPPEPGKEGE